MVIVMREDCLKKDIGTVLEAIRSHELDPRVISPSPRVVIGIVEDMDTRLTLEIKASVEGLPGVEEILEYGTSWKLVSRSFRPDRTIINVRGTVIGDGSVAVMAGPCAVESKESILEIAAAVKSAGAKFLRGGAFKPRTSPYSFRGLGEEGLQYLAEASRLTGLPVITEVMSRKEVPLLMQYADILQIGARNMQNFALLEAVGDIDKPVFLKRGLMGTIKELLLCAEYILARGNPRVILCERGIRTFEKETRNTLDLSAVPLLKQLSHLPVFVDPSHAVGKRELVPAMALAAVAAGADGLMIEVHPDPDKALSDGRQSLTPQVFERLMDMVNKVALAVSNGKLEELNATERGLCTAG